MTESVLDQMLASGVIAVLRARDVRGIAQIAHALHAGGVHALEITLTTPGAVDGIAELARAGEGILIGAGTVLDADGARRVMDAGAQFVVSPTSEPDVIRACRERKIPCIPGAFTPTEILAAWRAGASLVKLFPAAGAGPGFVRDLLAPLPFLRIVPSGGVTLESAGDWIRAGCAAVSIGRALLDAPPGELSARARAYVAAVRAARQGMDQSA